MDRIAAAARMMFDRSTIAARKALAIALAVTIATGSVVSAEDADPPPSAATHRQTANGLYNDERWPEAAEAYLNAANAESWDTRAAGDLYNSACCSSLGGSGDAAMNALQRSLSLNFGNPGHTLTDSDLASLHTHPDWPELAAELQQRIDRRADPAGARIITTDLHNFWRAHDLARRDPGQTEEIFRREYFDAGTPGLADYFHTRIESVDQFVQNYRATPRFFDAIREETLRTDDSRESFQAAFERLDELFPDAVFPDIYFVIGRFSSAGTVSTNGLLISADMMSAAPHVPVDEMSAGRQAVIRAMDGLVPLVTHELIHAQQKVRGDGTLLHGLIMEGGADFLAELVCGVTVTPARHAWADPREAELWADIQDELGGADRSQWLGNALSGTRDRPSDLGYYVGYRICKAYYEQADDPIQAIADMLLCRDPATFLATSGYAEMMAR